MQIEIESVEQVDEPQLGPVFRIIEVITRDDGRTERFLRIHPVWAVAARMAEYDVSQAQAVRMLLAEPYLPDRPDVPAIFSDPLWRRGAADHAAAAERAVATLGFMPLDARVEDVPADPSAVMRRLDVPAGLVAELRMRHAEQRAAWREATKAEASRASERHRPAPEEAPRTVVPAVPAD